MDLRPADAFNNDSATVMKNVLATGEIPKS